VRLVTGLGTAIVAASKLAVTDPALVGLLRCLRHCISNRKYPLRPLPGPGWGTLFVGLGMVASEVLHVARLLDRTEVKLREALRLAKDMWDKLALKARVLVTLMISLGVVASAYGAYRIFLVSLSALTVPSG
jgi:hypothetical protein